MSQWKFRCRDDFGRDLCFNGGTCTDSIDSQGINRSVCLRPPGFQGEADWFHFANCTRPWFSGIIILVIVVTVNLISLAYLAIVMRPKLRSDLKTLGILEAIFLVLLTLFASSFYAENGCYQMCSVSVNATFFVANWLCSKAIVILLRPTYAVSRRPFGRFKTSLYVWTGFTSCLLVGVAVTMTVFTTRPDRIDEYNIMAFLSTGLLWAGGLVQLGFVFVSSQKLKAEVRKMDDVSVVSTRNVNSKSLIRRLDVLAAGSFGLLLCFLILIIAVPAVFSSLGSFPYFFVVTYLEIIASVIFGIAILLFLKNTPASVGTSAGGSRVGSDVKGVQPSTHLSDGVPDMNKFSWRAPESVNVDILTTEVVLKADID